MRSPVLSMILMASLTQASFANGYGESAPWQFETPAARAVNAAILDLIEKKRGGYYDSFKNTTYNTSNTYIRQQNNCVLSSSASGNAGTNGTSAATSSPTVTNGASTSAGTTGNGASTTVGSADPYGLGTIIGTSTGSTATGNWVTGLGSGGLAQTNQSNAGSVLASGVSGSSTGASSGAIGAGGGTTYQVLNSTQGNSGAQSSAVSGSTACSGVGGPLN